MNLENRRKIKIKNLNFLLKELKTLPVKCSKNKWKFNKKNP